MATTLDIITRAFRKVGISGQGEALDAEALAEGLAALNAMMHGWKLRGVDVAHVDLASTDTFSLPQEYEEGTVYLLASRIAPDYEIPPSFDADDWFRTFQAAYMEIAEVEFPTAITRVPSQYFARPRLRR